MKSYPEWKQSLPGSSVHPRYRNGFNDGSFAAWEYRTNSFKIQQRVVNDLRKELDRALVKGARAVKANQLVKQRADRVERLNRNLTTQLRIAREELDRLQRDPLGNRSLAWVDDRPESPGNPC